MASRDALAAATTASQVLLHHRLLVRQRSEFCLQLRTPHLASAARAQGGLNGRKRRRAQVCGKVSRLWTAQHTLASASASASVICQALDQAERPTAETQASPLRPLKFHYEHFCNCTRAIIISSTSADRCVQADHADSVAPARLRRRGRARRIGTPLLARPGGGRDLARHQRCAAP